MIKHIKRVGSVLNPLTNSKKEKGTDAVLTLMASVGIVEATEVTELAVLASSGIDPKWVYGTAVGIWVFKTAFKYIVETIKDVRGNK